MGEWLDDQYRGIERLELRFKGDLWMMAAPLGQPVDEIGLFVVVDAAAAARAASGGPRIEIEFTGVDTTYGMVFVVRLFLYAYPQGRHVFEVFLNPATDEGAGWLRLIEGQREIQVIFFDCGNGSRVGRRVVALGRKMRESVSTVLELSKLAVAPPGSFPLAQAVAREQLPMP